MSSNTPQNLETPILGRLKKKKKEKGYYHLDKFRLRLRSAYRRLDDQAAHDTTVKPNQLEGNLHLTV